MERHLHCIEIVEISKGIYNGKQTIDVLSDTKNLKKRLDVIRL